SSRLLALVLLAAAVFPALYGARHPSMPNPDDYELVADNFSRTWTLSEDGVHPSAIREPGYPAVLGFFFKAFGHSSATVYLLNGLLAAGAALGLFLVGARLFGEGVG